MLGHTRASWRNRDRHWASFQLSSLPFVFRACSAFPELPGSHRACWAGAGREGGQTGAGLSPVMQLPAQRRQWFDLVACRMAESAPALPPAFPALSLVRQSWCQLPAPMGSERWYPGGVARMLHPKAGLQVPCSI